MEIQKELSSIALEMSEEEYRNSTELHYSTLSRFDQVGYDGLDHLFDKIESPSLTFGSCVDVLLTGSKKEFEQKFIVRDIKITDSGIATCKALANVPTPYPTFYDIPQRIVSNAAKSIGFWADDKYDKSRYDKVIKTGDVSDYYYSLINSDKTVISTEMYQDALNCVQALKDSSSTSGFFAEDDPFSPIKRYYQLKFKATINGIGYIVMSDLLVVDYENKIVYPCDLKTCGVSEWRFQENFVKYHYYIQAVLYWNVIRANLDNDPYFKDFKLADFKFIVVNKNSLTPLVWEYPLTTIYGTLVDERGNEHRDPFDLGKELRGYLDCRPPVPNGINKDGVNVITCLKRKE